MRALAAALAGLPEDRQIPKTSFEIWSGHMSELGTTEEEMSQVGEWFCQHYQTAPSVATVSHAVEWLHKHGSFPEHRMASQIDLNAMALLKAAELLGLCSYELAQSLMLAGTLTHLATYRRKFPKIDRHYIGTEVEGIARQCNYFADEILDEVQQGKGQLRDLDGILFGKNSGE